MKILYHANCTDGSGAALAAWMKLGDEGHEYIPVQYGNPVPEGMEDEDILMVDFSYKKDVILELGKIAKSILIIDHHKTAEADLKDFVIDGEMTWSRHMHVPSICPIEAKFDMEKSGAVLAWEHFYTGQVPRLLLYIQDRDLWKFEHERTNDICTALQLYPDFRDWILFIDKPIELHTELAPMGRGINEFLSIQTSKIIQSGPQQWKLTGAKVPIYNIPGFMISETLHQALEKYPESPYAVAYFDLTNGDRVYSLRSRTGSDVDVSKIAASLCGGGHKHAAGFKVRVGMR